jgi:hypothetical protein
MSKDKQNCDACKNNAGSEILCPLCQSIVGSSLGTDWNVVLSPREHEEGIELFGGRGRTSKQRWSKFKDNIDGTTDVTWARLRDNEDPIHSLPCSIERLQGIIHLIKEGHQLQHEERRLLQIGFALHDGKLLSFLQDTAVLDGRKLPAPIPMISILTLISDEKKRIGWNISKLVSTMGSLVHDAITSREQEHYGRIFNDYRRHRMMRRRELRDGRQQPNNCKQRPLIAMLTWLQIEAEDHLERGDSNGNHPLSAWARDVRLRVHVSGGASFKRVVTEAFDHHPKGSLDLITSPWISRWLNHRTTDRPIALKDWPLKLTRNKWQFRVRTKAGNSRLTNIPEDPVIWAYLISAVLSPLESQIGLNLLAMQSNWTASHDDKLDISAPMRRSISFLNQIISANSNNVFVQSDRILVVGRIGHFYEVRVGRGAHGAPFLISAIRHLDPYSSSPLCIHHGRFHAQVPLGDTIASVVLSLVDDVTLADRIESLRVEITTNSPFGFNKNLSPIEKPFIDAKALEQLRLQSPSGAPRIIWYDFEDDPHPEQEMAPLQNLLHRNRGVNYGEYLAGYIDRARGNAQERLRGQRTRRSTKYIDATLREVAQGNPPPIAKFVEEWRQQVSFKALDEATETNYRANPPYGNDWMYLRNNGMGNQNGVIGDIRNGERRWCELMPRIWQALQLQPLGSTIRVGEQNMQTVSFEHCNLRVTLRNLSERRTVVRLAELLGYVEDEACNGQRILVRRDHPRPNNRRSMTRLIEGLQQRNGARGAPPWWWHYGEAAEAPREVPEFAWELEEDLRDEEAILMHVDIIP